MSLSLLALKPTFGLPFSGFYCLYLLVLKKFRALSVSLLSLVLLPISGCLIDPDWIGKFVTVGSGKFNQTIGHNPSIWGIAGIVCQQSRFCTITVGGLIALGLIGATLYLIVARGKWLSPTPMFSLVIPVSLPITPYLWAYDQILLLTAFV